MALVAIARSTLVVEGVSSYKLSLLSAEKFSLPTKRKEAFMLGNRFSSQEFLVRCQSVGDLPDLIVHTIALHLRKNFLTPLTSPVIRFMHSAGQVQPESIERSDSIEGNGLRSTNRIKVECDSTATWKLQLDRRAFCRTH